MDEGKPSRAPFCGDGHFDNHILDLDRVLARPHTAHVVPHLFCFGDDQSGLPAGTLSGPALDGPADSSWTNAQPGSIGWRTGYEASQGSVIGQTRIAALQQAGDPLELPHGVRGALPDGRPPTSAPPCDVTRKRGHTLPGQGVAKN